MMMSTVTKHSQLLKNNLQFVSGVFDLVLKLSYDAIASINGIIGTSIGLKHDCMHSCVFLRRGKGFDDLGDIADSKELMRVKELTVTVVREIRSEKTIGSAFPALVFAGGAGLVCAAIGVAGAAARRF